MKEYVLMAPCHFGIEAMLKREIYDLGYDIESVEDGRVSFIGDEEAIVRAMCSFVRLREFYSKSGISRLLLLKNYFRG